MIEKKNIHFSFVKALYENMAMGHERILNMHMNIHAYKRVHMDIIAWLHGCIRLDVSRIIVHMHGSKLVYAHQYLNAKCSALR